jgi:hypothetical protein
MMNADQMREFVELCKHPAIAGRRGEWVGTDHAWWEDTGRPETCYADAPTDQAISGQLAVWLPPVYDYQHPERGLIGMLTKSGIFSMDLEWQPGLIEGWRVSINWYKDIHQFTGATPAIALAKAIIWQHERRKR